MFHAYFPGKLGGTVRTESQRKVDINQVANLITKVSTHSTSCGTFSKLRTSTEGFELKYYQKYS